MAYFPGNQPSRATKGSMHKSAISSGTNWNQKEPKHVNQIFGPNAKLDDILFWQSSIGTTKQNFRRTNQKRNSSIAASPNKTKILGNSTSFNSHNEKSTHNISYPSFMVGNTNNQQRRRTTAMAMSVTSGDQGGVSLKRNLMSFEDSENVTHSIELRRAHDELKRASDLRSQMMSKQQIKSGSLTVSNEMNTPARQMSTTTVILPKATIKNDE